MNEMTKRSITSTVLGLVVWISIIYLNPIVFSLLLAGALIHIMWFEWPKFFSINTPAFWLITPFYPLLPFALLFALNVSPNPSYHYLLFMLFVLVSTFDSGSFMVGTKYGKHTIAPKISPAKTWEGFFGGCIATLLCMVIVMLSKDTPHGSWLSLSAVTLIVCVISLCGDLFESWLKRRAHLKDSGYILPGHGGFLDRLDGVLFAVFFFYIFKAQLALIFVGA